MIIETRFSFETGFVFLVGTEGQAKNEKHYVTSAGTNLVVPCVAHFMACAEGIYHFTLNPLLYSHSFNIH